MLGSNDKMPLSAVHLGGRHFHALESKNIPASFVGSI
jgi:hypothetical protein